MRKHEDKSENHKKQHRSNNEISINKTWNENKGKIKIKMKIEVEMTIR